MNKPLHPGAFSRRGPALGALAMALAAGAWMPAAVAATPDELLAAYVAQAKQPASAERGQKLFTTNFGRDLGFSCSSCHGAEPVKLGRDQVTEKSIQPLAPAFNPVRFTDKTKTDTWFRLNCRDVVGRDCTAAEKADVLSWLLTFKR
ncbi:MAG: cytochrome C [Leptothrix sp. (in: Bacteria)]|nr:cytochrome C [Leptothrix sp. (in: b-proteobacteria)]